MFKRAVLVAMVFLSGTVVAAEDLCVVKVCNKIERVSIDPWSHIKDAMAEACFDTTLPKSQAVVGSILNKESRWYQGTTINPTKKSVTRIKLVYECYTPLVSIRFN